ncbi:unnamed protein product [Haemonchus placei]|uniref:CCHC-type domain-containing protein n=1 Tax=Haemonchus placei TaxID=6290 RepID=A0A0N4X8P7_HAEPC|nr:unnamed protein product [Haemonchus placei]
MAELVASEDAERTLNNALVAGGEPVQQAAMDVDMAEASGVRNAELEELKVCGQMHKKLKEAEIAVVAEVARHWRSGDAKRDKFEAVARAAIQAVEEQLDCLKGLYAKKREENVGVRELMISLGCGSRVEMVQVVEELVEKASVLEEVQKCTGWADEDLVRECSELKRKLTSLSRKNHEILSLQRQLEEKQREIDQLRAEQAAVKKGLSATDEAIPGTSCQIRSKYDLEGLKRLRNAWSGDDIVLQNGRELRPALNRLTRDSSRQCLRKTLESNGECRAVSSDDELSEIDSHLSSRSSRYSGRNSSACSHNGMSSYLKYIALPEVRVYTGRDKSYSWENFLESFQLKYPEDSWSQKELKALLKSKLSDRAKAQYEALPREVRHGPYAGIVAALSKSNRVEEKTERIRALGKLRRLKKAEAQTVAEYCVELERLSARAYPELDEGALATTRAQQLYEQIVQWPESYYFLEAMEKEGPSAYESLKEAAMRVERRRLTLESARAQSYHAAGERLEGTSRHERSRVPAKMEKSIKRDEDDNRRQSELPNKEKEEPRYKEKGGQMQCFNCRGKGHLARECKVRRELGSKATEVLLEETKPPRAPEKRCPSSVVPPFGKKSVASVTIFGNAWSALLDTGSEISILPQKVLQRIEEEGHRLQECPMDLRKRILDASGNRMKFLKVVEVPLKEGTGTEITLQMHVSVQKGHMLVLGTNALQAMNYTLVRRPSEDCRKGEVAEEALGKPSQEAQSASKATVCKRVYVAPGEFKWVAIKGDVKLIREDGTTVHVVPRLEDEYEVADTMHFLHVKFRCDGQPFPALEGRAGFPLETCRCSRNTFVKDMLSEVPQPACEERIECVLDAARVLSIWWDPGSISLKVQRIMDRSYQVLRPKAVGFAYAFFRHRCLHVGIMAGTVPQKALFCHSQIQGWSLDLTRIIEYGWRIGRQMEWKHVEQSVQKAQEHSRTVVVVPEVLHRLKHCLTSSRTVIFYYKSFREVRATNTSLFADDIGKVVYVLPPKEPADPFSWLQFVNAINLWLTCGAHVIVVNGPRSSELNSWDRMNEKARNHLNGYVDTYPAFLSQLHYLIPSEPGVLSSAMACLKVGLVQDQKRWWAVDQAVEFYGFLRHQVKEFVQLESVKIPKALRPRGNPSVVVRTQSSGGPAIRDGRISKRHLKRVEKRKLRSLQRATERRLDELSME